MKALRRTGLVALAALGLAGPALACSCPPTESAAAQAETADFVGVVMVGEVLTLVTPEQEADDAARSAFERSYTQALRTYIDAVEAGEAVATFDEYMQAFFASASYRPPPYIIGAELTQMRVQRVLKGENLPVIFVRSSPPGMPACGISFRPDTEVLLIAHGENGLYRASMCDLPQHPVEAFEDALTPGTD